MHSRHGATATPPHATPTPRWIKPVSISTAILTVAAGCAPSLARAAQLTLDNGDQISGEIVHLENQSLTFHSPLFGEVRIPWARVAELKSDGGVRIQLADGTRLAGSLVLQRDGRIVIDDERGAARHLTRSDVAILNPPVVDQDVKYSGQATLGGTVNRGNSRDESLNLDGKLVARASESRYTANLEANEARSAGVTTISKRLLSIQYDAFLTDRNYLFVSAQAQSDARADLDRRASLSAGYGHQFYETDRSKLSAQTGVTHVNENHDVAPDGSFSALSLAVNYEQKFFSRKLVLFNTMDASIGIEKTSDTLVKNKLGLRVPIANGLNFSTQLNAAHDRSPPPGIQKTDTTLIFGLGYAF